MTPLQHFIASDPPDGHKSPARHHSVHHVGVQDQSQSNELSPPESNITASMGFGNLDTSQARKTQDIDLVGAGAQFWWYTGPESNEHPHFKHWTVHHGRKPLKVPSSMPLDRTSSWRKSQLCTHNSGGPLGTLRAMTG